MPDIYVNLLTFNAVPPATPTVQPHLLNVDAVAMLPDRLEGNNAEFALSADNTNVTVVNNGAGVDTVQVWVQVLHSIPRAFPPGFTGAGLPFTPSGGGGAALDSAGAFVASDGILSATGDVALAFDRNNHPVLSFNDTTNETVLFAGIVPRNYSGGDLVVTLFWAAATAIAGDVRWGVEFERNNAGGPFDLDVDSFAAQQAMVATAPGTSGFVAATQIQLTQAQADNIMPGDPYRLRVERGAASATDTMAGDAQLTRVLVEAA